MKRSISKEIYEMSFYKYKSKLQDFLAFNLVATFIISYLFHLMFKISGDNLSVLECLPVGLILSGSLYSLIHITGFFAFNLTIYGIILFCLEFVILGTLGIFISFLCFIYYTVATIFYYILIKTYN